MRKLTLSTALLSAGLAVSAFGCIDVELDTDAMDTLAKDKAPAAVNSCDFGSAEIFVGTPYTVSIANDKLDMKKTYLVEVTLAGTLQSLSGSVAQKGLMRVPVTPQKVGQGAIAVYETKTKKDKVQKKLATQCSFVAQAKPVVEDPVEDDPIIDDPIDDDPIGDDPIGNDPIDDDPIEDDPIIDDPIDDDPNVEYCGPIQYDTSKEKYADRFCGLCKDMAFNLSDRGNFIIDSSGRTCNQLMMEMADPSNASKPGSAACYSLQKQYRDTCCNPECTPRPVDQVDTLKVPYPQGDQPVCHLCDPYGLPSAQYPLKPNTITAVLGMNGNPTCKDLYWMGLTGNIEDRMCRPMQIYMKEPCGCALPADEPGPNEWCDICLDGVYPLRPGISPTGLGLTGNPTCQQLYWMGRAKTLSSSVCQKLQRDHQDSCGCPAVK